MSINPNIKENNKNEKEVVNNVKNILSNNKKIKWTKSDYNKID